MVLRSYFLLFWPLGPGRTHEEFLQEENMKTRVLTIIIALLVTVSLIPVVSWGDLPSRMAPADKNGDGKLTKEEFVENARARSGEMAAKRFDKMDSDQDGFVTSDEANAAMEKMKERKKGMQEKMMQ